MKIRYKAGDVCAIPLHDGSYCLGVVGRRSGRSDGITLFVFCDRHARQIDQLSVVDLHAKKANEVFRTGGEPIANGRWPLVGQAKDWRPEEWAVPVFRRDLRYIGIDSVERVFYDLDDPQKPIREIKDHDPSEPLPNERSPGYLSLERELTERILGREAVHNVEVQRPRLIETFDNDYAADWLDTLRKDGLDAINEALDAVVKLDAREFLDSPEVWCAVAAAECVAAGCDGNFGRIPEPSRSWLRRRRASLSYLPLRTLAQRALRRILNEPGFEELWHESSDYKAWRTDMRSLIKRLNG